AVESTYGLNDDPTCSRDCHAVLFMQVPSHWAGVRFCPLPGYSAMISPVFGFCSSAPTSAHGGSDVTVAPEVFLIDCEFRLSLTALYSAASLDRLIVVTTLRPPVSSCWSVRPS